MASFTGDSAVGKASPTYVMRRPMQAVLPVATVLLVCYSSFAALDGAEFSFPDWSNAQKQPD